jgi:hypothetical protein
MDGASALVIIVEEAREVLDVREIQSVVWHQRRTVLEVTTAIGEIPSEIDMHPDRRLEI